MSLFEILSDSVTNNELRLVLIGITGSGKSSSANTILGDELFYSKASASSVTATCKVEHKTRFGQNIVIVDTPGAFDTVRSHGQITKEIIQCITMSAPGPHAFIMVVQAKRFTPEDQKTIKYFEEVFGDRMFNYLILLFTGMDNLEADKTNLEEFLLNKPAELETIMNRCNGRYVGFNNREKDEKKKERMVQQLIDMIKTNVTRNGGKCYTSEFLEAAEKEVQKREHKLLKEKEKNMEEEIEKRVRKEIEKHPERSLELQHYREQQLINLRHELAIEARNEVRQQAERDPSFTEVVGTLVVGACKLFKLVYL